MDYLFQSLRWKISVILWRLKIFFEVERWSTAVLSDEMRKINNRKQKRPCSMCSCGVLVKRANCWLPKGCFWLPWKRIKQSSESKWNWQPTKTKWKCLAKQSDCLTQHRFGGHLLLYLDTKAFGTDCIGKYKARKAFSYFKSLHVHQVLTYTPKDSGGGLWLQTLFPFWYFSPKTFFLVCPWSCNETSAVQSEAAACGS